MFSAPISAIVSATSNADGKTQTVVERDLTAMGPSVKRFLRLKVATP